jgi:hypothetical protein
MFCYSFQKKQRSDTIISINKKYSLITGRENGIIERGKNELDKDHSNILLKACN